LRRVRAWLAMGSALAEQRLDVVAATAADTLAVSQLGEMTARAGNLRQTLADPAADRDARPPLAGSRPVGPQTLSQLAARWPRPAGP
jgi:hypothetical protein